jgi:hypothetical protein
MCKDVGVGLGQVVDLRNLASGPTLAPGSERYMDVFGSKNSQNSVGGDAQITDVFWGQRLKKVICLVGLRTVERKCVMETLQGMESDAQCA